MGASVLRVQQMQDPQGSEALAKGLGLLPGLFPAF